MQKSKYKIHKSIIFFAIAINIAIAICFLIYCLTYNSEAKTTLNNSNIDTYITTDSIEHRSNVSISKELKSIQKIEKKLSQKKVELKISTVTDSNKIEKNTNLQTTNTTNSTIVESQKAPVEQKNLEEKAITRNKKQALGNYNENSIDVSDNDPGKRLFFALQLATKGDTLEARKIIAEITDKNKKFMEAWNEMARFALLQNDKKTATKALKRLLSMAYTKKLKKNIEKSIELTANNNFNEAILIIESLKTEKQFK